MLTRVFARATCPSVHHTPLLYQKILHLLVATRVYFSAAKFHHKIQKGSPRAGASNKGGVGKISSFLSFSIFKPEYLENGSIYGESYN